MRTLSAFFAIALLGSSLPADAKVSKAEYNRVIDQFIEEFSPIAKVHKGALEVERRWESNKQAAESNLHEGLAGSELDLWVIWVHGGVARHSTQTPDGLLAVICHELGHLMGGFPFKYDEKNMPGYEWVAAEGQSDYFATQACLRRIFGKQVAENEKSRATVDPTAKRKCDGAWNTRSDRDLCYRVAMAGLAISRVHADHEGVKISFSTPDKTKVSSTEGMHPGAQCRLDTALAGALCTAEFDFSQIPGRGHPDGQDSVRAEKEALETSCMAGSGHKIGLRPRCWFMPRL